MLVPETIWLALGALAAEALLGYPAWLYRFVGHPVSWIGWAIAAGERRLNRPDAPGDLRRARGWGLIIGLVVIVAIVALAISDRALDSLPGFAVLTLCASTLIAQRSLHDHVCAVADGLSRSLEDGRTALAKIVGRNVEELDEAGIARAAIESLAENFSDGIVAPTFWLALFGLPGAAIYKTINTADSMIGHKTERYRAFGFAAAKIDDVANWPAALIAGVLIVASAALGWRTSAKAAWRVMRRDASKHASPNAGWPEAAMAGALGIRLGGPRAYGGVMMRGAWLGDDDETVDAATISRALAVYRRALVLQFLGLALAAWLLL